jgi:MFS family permease
LDYGGRWVRNNQFILLGQRRFGPYFATQFLGAFNDNVFKNALLLLLAFHAADRFTLSSDVLINLSAGLFILPYFLFSGIAGQFADKYEKAMLIRRIKLFEIIVMAVAAVALWQDAIGLLIGLLFLMGFQSSLFGPVKYGLLPQVATDDELVGANGLVETGTFLAILLGTALGGVLIGVDDFGRLLVAGAVLVLAVLGYLVSRSIPALPAQVPNMEINWNPLRATWDVLQVARKERLVWVSVIGISWFWFVGSVYLAQLPNFSRIYLAGDERVVTVLLTLFSIGVAVGSLLCERLTGRRVDVALVLVGAAGMTVFGVDLGLTSPAAGLAGESSSLQGAQQWLREPAAWRVCADVLLLGLAGGLYIVPLYSVVQQRSALGERSRVIAANNVLNALFMVVAALLAAGLLSAGLTIGTLFLLVAALNTLVMLGLLLAEPEYSQSLRRWLVRATE